MIPAKFFPSGIRFFFSEEKKKQDVLTDKEWEVARTYGIKRLADYCTGRYCLHQCLDELGFSGDILIRQGGGPLLPTHITASISHSAHLTGAVAAAKDNFMSVGLDIETLGRVKHELWRLLFTQREVAFLHTLPQEKVDFFTTAIFSLKEAFYKLQHPLTGIFLDFPDVEVAILHNRFYIKTLKHVSSLFPEGRMVGGNVLQLKNQVIGYFAMSRMHRL